MFDSVTAAEDNMKSKLLGAHNKKRARPREAAQTSLRVFDSVTAAEDNMKSKLPGAQNTWQKKRPRNRVNHQERITYEAADKVLP